MASGAVVKVHYSQYSQLHAAIPDKRENGVYVYTTVSISSATAKSLTHINVAQHPTCVD